MTNVRLVQYSTPEPLLSVVTVVRRDDAGLRRTLASLASRLDGRCELIVVEGDEPDLGSAGVVLADAGPATSNVTLVQGTDLGPYHGMNRGILVSRGAWIWFLNAGDELHPDLNLHELLSFLEAEASLWVTAPVEVHSEGGGQLMPVASTEEILRGAQSQCHQGAFFHRFGISSAGIYDLQYKIASDYDLMSTLAVAAKPGVFPKPVAVFHRGGLSSVHRKRLHWENFRIRWTDRNFSLLWHLVDLARMMWRVTVPRERHLK